MRLQDRAGEVRLIGRVGEGLGLEAKPAALHVRDAALAHQRSIEKVAGIELYARLRRLYGQHATGLRIMHRSRRPQRAGLAADDPVVVIATTEDELVVLRANA